MHQTSLRLLAIALTAVTLIACQSPSSGSPNTSAARDAATSAATPMKPAPAPSNARDAALIYDGLVSLAALKLLPEHATQPFRGYSGSKWHHGAFTRAADYDAFRAAAGVKATVDVNWEAEMVAFLIFDAQTNDLSYKGWEDGAISFVWSGIEPFYSDATPGLLVRVPRAKTRFVEEGGQGTFEVAP